MFAELYVALMDLL